MDTDINVIVNQDVPAANVKVSITSHDFFRNHQKRINWWIVNKNKLYVLKHDKQKEERK